LSPSRPSEYSVPLIDAWTLPPRRRSPGVSCSFRVSPAEVSPLLVGRSRHAVSHFLGFAVFLQRAFPDTVKWTGTNLSSSFALRRSIRQRTLVSRPQPADSSHGLWFPLAHQGSEVHFSRVYQARSVPPSGFGYPLDGLRPPSPCRPCFIPAALQGFTLRSLALSRGTRTFPPGWTHIPFRLS